MIKKFKYGLYTILFLATVSLGAVRGVFALFNANVESSLGVEYAVQEEVSVRLAEGIKFGAYGMSDALEIIFDYATEENLALVENAETCESVAEDGSDDILMYRVKNPSDSTYSCYILASGTIYASANCSEMFSNCGCESIKFNNFNTSDVADMQMMFDGCYNLTSLDLSSFDTSNVTAMYFMFRDCYALASLDLSSFDTSNVRIMPGMFYHCYSLTNLDLSSFDTSNVTDMSNMFTECWQITTIYVSSSWSTSNVIDSFDMFLYCHALVGGNGSVFNEAYTDATYARIDTASTPGYFTQGTETSGPTESSKYPNQVDGYVTLVSGSQFQEHLGNSCHTVIFDYYGAEYEEIVEASPSDIPVAEDSSNDIILYKVGGVAYVLSYGDIYLNSDSSEMFYGQTSLTSLVTNNFNTTNVTDMQRMFSNCTSLTNLDLSSFDTSNVTNMNQMFYNCDTLTSLDLSLFNTSEVEDMGQMFYNCIKLTSLNLSSFDTSKVTDMSGMFYDCYDLTSLDLSSFNTSKVTNMEYMFAYCRSFTSLDLSSFNTSKVTNMEYMFAYCRSFTSLDLSSFNTSKVTDMSNMFQNCTALTILDLSSFDTSKVTSMYCMFVDCSNLTTIFASSSWSTASVTKSTYMFNNCTKLVGGNGTTIQTLFIDATYARIDTASTPGYFTLKS